MGLARDRDGAVSDLKDHARAIAGCGDVLTVEAWLVGLMAEAVGAERRACAAIARLARDAMPCEPVGCCGKPLAEDIRLAILARGRPAE